MILATTFGGSKRYSFGPIPSGWRAAKLHLNVIPVATQPPPPGMPSVFVMMTAGYSDAPKPNPGDLAAAAAASPPTAQLVLVQNEMVFAQSYSPLAIEIPVRQPTLFSEYFCIDAGTVVGANVTASLELEEF